MSSNVFGNQSTPSLISVAEAASKVMKLDEHCGECGAMDHIDEKKGMLPRPGAGAYKTPEERKKDAETKKRLKMFKSLRKEEVEEIVEEVSEKDFDSLKKGDTITIDFKSPMSSGKATFKVTAKNIVGKAKVHKATLKDVKRPGGVKFYLYKRGNKVSLAQGDMAATVSKYTIEQVVSEDEDMEKVVKELENASKMHLGQSKRIKKHLDKMKKEEVELDEAAGKTPTSAEIKTAGKKLKDYAMKSGGIDKNDFLSLADTMMRGKMPNADSINNMDTDPREFVFDLMAKEFGYKYVQKYGGITFTRPKEYKEEVELDESSVEYAKSLEKIANDRALKMLTKSERENLKKIAALLDKERKMKEEAEMAEPDSWFEGLETLEIQEARNPLGGKPFEELKGVADAALKIMTGQPQEVKEEEKQEANEDKPQKLTEEIV